MSPQPTGDDLQGDWVESVLFWATTLIIVSAALWLVLWLYQSSRRKALNLTTTETVREAGVKPDFLTVDHEKRDAALRGGEAFDKHVAERDAPPPSETDETISKCCGFARLMTIVLALVSLVTGVIGALMRVEAYDSAVRKYGAWDNAVQIISDYPVGFAVAIGVVGLVGFNFVRTLRGNV